MIELAACLLAALCALLSLGYRRELLKRQEQQNQYRSFLERNLSGVFRSTIDGQIRGCNDAFVRLLGYDSQDDLLARRGSDLYPTPEHRESFLSLLRRRGSVSGHEIRVRRKDGSVIWALENVALVPGGDGPALIEGTIIDITVRKRAEHMLESINRIQRESIVGRAPAHVFNLLLESLIEATESEYGFIGEVLVNDDGRRYLKTHAITDIAWDEETRRLVAEKAPNLEFENLDTFFGEVIKTGKPVISNDLAGDPRGAGLPTGHLPLQAFAGLPCIQGENLVGMAGIANRRGGYDAAVMEQMRPLLATCTALILGYRNAQRRAEAESRAQRLKSELAHVVRVSSMSQMALGIAHEINQPLTAVINYTGGTLRQLEPGKPVSDKVMEALTQAATQAKRAGDIVHRITNLVRRRAPEWATFDLHAALVEVLEFAAAEAAAKDVMICLDAPASSLWAQGDRIQIQQVMHNLVKNAVEAMAETAASERKLIVGAVRCDDHCLGVTIKDVGCGVEPERVQRIFEPFHSTKAEGLGMGLAICRSIIDAHHGSLDASSNPEGGMTFRFTVPQASGGGDCDGE